MAYNPLIPIAPNLLSVDQANIQQNFSAISTFVNINHVDFNTADQGKHKWVTMPVQAAIPPAGSGFGTTEIGLYNAVNPTTSKSELYINKVDNATVVQVPSTASLLSITATPATGSNAWTYLPSGIILLWGTRTSAPAGTSNVILATENPSAPALQKILNVLVCPFSASGGDVDYAVRMVGYDGSTPPLFFTVYSSSRTTFGSPTTGSFQWLLIGY